MRGELQLLNAKLAARDKQLLKHVQVGTRSVAVLGHSAATLHASRQRLKPAASLLRWCLFQSRFRRRRFG